MARVPTPLDAGGWDTLGRVVQAFVGLLLALVSMGALLGSGFLMFVWEGADSDGGVIAGLLFAVVGLAVLYCSVRLVKGVPERLMVEHSDLLMGLVSLLFLGLLVFGIVGAINEHSWTNWHIREDKNFLVAVVGLILVGAFLGLLLEQGASKLPKPRKKKASHDATRW